jgi:hypothetical protein
MKKLLLISLLIPSILHAGFFDWFKGDALLGNSTINRLDQWAATTTPLDSITQRVFGKAVRFSGYSSGCIEADSNGVLTSTGSACGTGGGGSSFSTTSADYWKTVRNFFSTTSTDYWLTENRGNAFSTTSADWWGSLKGYLTGNQTITLSGDASGSGSTAITVTVADDSHAHTGSTISGLDISADTNLAVTSPIILTDDTVSIQNASADGSTKGAASFTASDFDASSGNISIDYTNGQAASASAKGFLTSANWSLFNNKISSTSLSASAPIEYNSSTGVISCPTCGVSSGNWATTSENNYWNLFRDLSVQGNGYLAPTTTRGLIFTASSTMVNLQVVNGTTTNATTTNLAFTGLTNGGLGVTSGGQVYRAATTTYSTESGPLVTLKSPELKKV